MKRLIILLVALLLLVSCAQAEPKTYDLGAMSLDELIALRKDVESAIMAACAAQTDSVFSAVREQPAPIGATVRYDGSDYMNKAVTDLTVLEVIRGDRALQMIRTWDAYNPRPGDGMEYIIVLVRASAVAAQTGARAEVYDYDFSFISAEGVEYEYAYAAGVSKELTALYEGASCEGYIVGLVERGDDPLMVYLKDSGRPFWFDLNAYAPVEYDEETVLPMLKRGDVNEEVRALQQKLIDLGYLNDVADGNFGRKTEAAVRAFQQANGLEETGAANDQTRRLLLAIQ